MKLQVDESLPKYINDSIATLEKILTSDNFSAFERLTRVSRGEIFVLKILLYKEGTSTPTEISEAMKSTKGRISAILNSLEKKGFISREIDKDNRRNIIVTLSDSGRDYVVKELRECYRIVAHVFEELGEEDSNKFVELAERVFHLMNE
ncbi:MAG: MarR family transcriptional regulator [Alphaproteobacteria bacterium]|nr:MarR family transcriptional regulator [Alphaproteobacteria bacterium]MBQ2936406.1 MarR family transcriptional regulator [Lachnospiraceae bacterium]